MSNIKLFNAENERKKLNKIVDSMPEDRKGIVEGLICEASFLIEQLSKLRAYVDENGWSEEYQNGANQKGKKQSVEAAAYLNSLKLYSSVIKVLLSCMPTETEKNKADGEELLEFLKKGKTSCI